MGDGGGAAVHLLAEGFQNPPNQLTLIVWLNGGEQTPLEDHMNITEPINYDAPIVRCYTVIGNQSEQAYRRWRVLLEPKSV